MSKKLKIYYDSKGKTLSVWFDDPKKEVSSRELGGGIIVSKDKEGKIIGFEKLYFKASIPRGKKSLPLEVNFLPL